MPCAEQGRQCDKLKTLFLLVGECNQVNTLLVSELLPPPPLGNVEYLFIAIALWSTLAWSGST